MITATPELADIFARARDNFLSPRSRDATRVSPSDAAVMQRFADTIAAMLDVAARDLARGWSLLAAGRVDDPSKEGQVVLYVVRHGLVLLTKNPKDFVDLHDALLAAGGNHPGILLIYQDNDPTCDMAPAEIVRAVARVEEIHGSTGLANQLFVLNRFRW